MVIIITVAFYQSKASRELIPLPFLVRKLIYFITEMVVSMF